METKILNYLRHKRKNKIPNKEKKRLLKDNNYSKLFDNEKKYLKIIKLISLASIIIIIILIVFIIILFKKLKETSFQRDIYEIFRANQDINLFLKNKTEFYYQERKDVFKKYDESNLKTLADKINYLVIHESAEYKSNIVDKIKLSEYSKKILGKNICVPILKIYNNVDEINLDELPDKFVLKCNHGSGMNIFCKDKSKFDLEKSKIQLNKWLNINYGLGGGQFQYYFIKRKIFASPYLDDDMAEYKAFCFNGNPKYIVAKKLLNERIHQYAYNFYDLNWTLTDIEHSSRELKRVPNLIIEKPKNLDLLIEYAKKLSEEFVFVRVDFYETQGKLYLGELTFTPTNNLNTYKNEAQRIYLGNLLDVTKIKPSLFNK